jgi:hypothetical protein
MEFIENVKVLGEITAKAYDQSKLKFLQRIINKIVSWAKTEAPFNFVRKFVNRYFLILYQFGPLKFVDEHKNVICNNGFNAITRLLVGDTTYTGEINKALLGSGTTGNANASDETLEIEEYRNDIASGTASSNIAYLTAYFTEAEVSGTFTEFGNCIDGGVGANTGQLWSHLKGLNWVKDGTTVLVVSCKYTFASV